MIIGFTGTQRGMSSEQKRVFTVLTTVTIAPTEFHHGDCIGADAQAWSIIKTHTWTVCHPPLNASKRAWTKNDEEREAKEYLERNHDIVNSTQMLIATPGEQIEQLRSGTWATIRYTRQKKHPIYIIFPDGTIRVQ